MGDGVPSYALALALLVLLLYIEEKVRELQAAH